MSSREFTGGKIAPGTTGISVRPIISSVRSVCATSSSRHWSPLTTVMPSTSVCGDCISRRIACWSVLPGPRASWSIITLRFACAETDVAIARSRRSAEAVRIERNKMWISFRKNRRVRADAAERFLLFRFGRCARHQLDEFAVELCLVEIFLDHHLLLAKPRLAARHPDESVAIARAV